MTRTAPVDGTAETRDRHWLEGGVTTQAKAKA